MRVCVWVWPRCSSDTGRTTSLLLTACSLISTKSVPHVMRSVCIACGRPHEGHFRPLKKSGSGLVRFSFSLSLRWHLFFLPPSLSNDISGYFFIFSNKRQWRVLSSSFSPVVPLVSFSFFLASNGSITTCTFFLILSSGISGFFLIFSGEQRQWRQCVLSSSFSPAASLVCSSFSPANINGGIFSMFVSCSCCKPAISLYHLLIIFSILI